MAESLNKQNKFLLNTISLANIEERKSAFYKYKASNTILTNLQRGNTQANLSNAEIHLNFHEQTGQGEITVEQIKQQPEIDVLDENNFTPLHWACNYGQIAASALLIENGANVNKMAPDLISPLILAASGGHHEIVRLLLQRGADVKHKDIIGNTALMYAAFGNHPHTCNEILAYEPSITDSNENGDTAYSIAVANNSNLAQAVLDNYLVSLLTS